MRKASFSSNVSAPTLHTVVVVLVGAILAAVPLYATQYVFTGLIFEKTMLFYGLMTLLILAYLWLVHTDRQYLPSFNLVGWAFALLIIGWIVSMLTSQQPYPSFWGIFNRMEGLVSWLYYFAFFVVIIGTLKKLADWWMVLKITMFGVALVVLYALAQLFGISLFATSANRWRVESTLGNPVFLGGYLASVLPLILVWAFSLKSSKWAWALMVAAIVIWVFTLSRGAWIAGVVAVPLTLTFYFYRYRPVLIKKTLVFLGFGFIAVAILSVSWLIAPKGSAFKNIGDKMIVRSESMFYRQNNWTIGLQAFIQKPLTGWGLENFHVAYDQNYRVFDRHVGFTESHVDRPHNEYIGVAVAGGLGALIPYLLIIGYAIYFGWRQAKSKLDPDIHLIHIGMLGALIGYAIFVFTAFNLITNILFLILALAWMNQFSSNYQKIRTCRFYQPILVLLGVIAVVAAYFTIVVPVQAVRLADQATIELQKKNYRGSLELFKKALAKKSFMSNTIRAQMSVLTSSGGALTIDNQQLTEFQKYTGSILRDIFKTEPYTSYTHMIVGMFYGSLSDKLPEFIPIADSVFQETADLSPKKGETWLRWGEMYADLGDWPKAKPKFERSMELDPFNRDIKFTSGVWYIYFGESERGDELVNRAMQANHPAQIADVKKIGDAFEHAGRYDKVETLYRQIIDKPQNTQDTVYAIVALIDAYRRSNRWADARTLAEELSKYELDPNEVAQLIRDIESRVVPPSFE
ncbi:hypothetical protein A2994_00055 [candidate division Kazan bacterium RIFCSPLOWO2_01_FULL_48_13]|uniref:O-antigen ligase-related domain-containing protein n=1 Tax=candidate division Kazan bacterium RIFCSPLOWO2_01_FULL_48_13 TaxID=1798539 RepID=A0A1F4PNH0_UNCK3|nr:MAG: hypothetical protein A2994_00055 [candidate division Kazan bacterium RIFCSPLOWO2_01_FULL_48_13]